MPEHPASAIGNLADLQEGQIALSRFIVQGDRGLYVKRSRLESPSDFLNFVDRVVASGLYFRGLDYAKFVALLYDEPAAGTCETTDEVFVAADITRFRPERQALYKGLRIESGEATYLFQPVYLEATAEPAGSSENDESSSRPADAGRPPREVRTSLDIDEFIASAWEKGLRFGIDIAAVQEAIQLDKPLRRVVARDRPFVPGTDAEIVEQSPGLRRNNAPRRLLGGKVDLCQFETRYPQVAAGVRLVKKRPRTPGVDGRDIGGKVLPAPPSRDLDLEAIAGPGTQVSRDKDGEYLVTSVSGFLQIDTRSNQFSVADRIISHEGVSARTTGDLLLTGEVYEQHGEIQEKRIVKCRSITAYADVFGNIVSAGGVVHLKSNLVGGSASNDHGDIIVDGVASGSTLSAPQGSISLHRAENCVIIGRQVAVEHATNCDIVADDLSIEVAEACAAAGKTIRVRRSRARRELDNLLLVLVPDLSALETRVAALEQKCAALTSEAAGHRRQIEALRGEKEVASYLVLAGKLRRHEMTLKPEQQVSWRRLSAQVAPLLRTLSQLGEAANEMDAEVKRLGAQIEEERAARDESSRGVACTVDAVEGETQVRTLLVRLADTPLSALSTKDLKARLRRRDGATKALFAGSTGVFSWTYWTPG